MCCSGVVDVVATQVQDAERGVHAQSLAENLDIIVVETKAVPFQAQSEDKGKRKP